MKRNSFFLILVSAATILVGCNRDSTEVVAVQTLINLSAEIARAKTENKLLLLEFGSSDSCPPCILFQKEVFSKPEFLAYEKSNLVFVRLDFPFRTTLPADVNATNVLLAQQFAASGFPTFIALDPEGNEFWRMPAKGDPNPSIETSLFQPKVFIALLESLKKKP